MSNVFSGMYKSVTDAGFQAQLDTQIANLMGDKDKIAVDVLKKNTIFNDFYKNLDESAKARVNNIFSLDGDSETVSEKELRTLLTLFDADLAEDNGHEVFMMDHEFGTNKETSGIYQATDSEIDNIYKNMKTKYERAAEEIKKQQEAEQKETLRKDIEKQIKECDIKDGSQLTKVLNLIFQNDEIIDTDEAIKTLFKEQILKINTAGLGWEISYKLKSRTTVCYNASLVLDDGSFHKIGEVTIKRPDGTCEKYNKNGELISINSSVGNEWISKSYDENGNVVAEYDEYDYLTKKIDRNADGTVNEYYDYEYDANGNMTSVVCHKADDSVDWYEDIEYDEYGHMLKEVGKNADGTVNEYFDYEYDANGNKTKIVIKNADGSVVEYYEYEYDENGNLMKELKKNSDGSVIDE
jgi:hypothetical protein